VCIPHAEADYVQIEIAIPLEGTEGHKPRQDAALGVRQSNARAWRLALRMLVALLTAVTLVQLTGCASVPRGGDAGVYDPLEPMNRAVFKANMALDRAFVKPIAQGYRAILPEFVRDRFHSFVENLI